MPTTVGHIEAIFRYPVKSMRGEPLEQATLGWHGLAGDRRLALRRVDDRGGFPWLSASRLHDLVRFTPVRRGDATGEEALPTHVRTPEGEELPVSGEALAAEIARRHGFPVQMTHFKHGIFDEGSVSILTPDTVREIGRLAGKDADIRRFRPNIVVRTARAAPFEEDEWVGAALTFGDAADAPAVGVTLRDVRCSMISIDPDAPGTTPELHKAVVRAHDNTAGVYATVTRVGRLAVGQPVLLHRGPPAR